MGTQVCEGCWGWSTEGNERSEKGWSKHPLGCFQTVTIQLLKQWKTQESEVAPDPRHLLPWLPTKPQSYPPENLKARRPHGRILSVLLVCPTLERLGSILKLGRAYGRVWR